MVKRLDEKTIRRALARLADLLRERNVQGEVCLFGGAVMVLAFKARPSTKDVDAIFEPAALIRDLARRIQSEEDLPENWLNDAAKGYISSKHEVTTGDLPQFENLRVTAPVPEYLLAMKCLATRIGMGPADSGDLPDIRLLIQRLGLKSVAEAMDIVKEYYPESRIPPRARFALEDLFASREDGSP